MEIESVLFQKATLPSLISNNTPPVMDVLVEEGIITEIAPEIAIHTHRTIHATGLWILPGILDLMVHTYDPEAFIQGGITGVRLPPLHPWITQETIPVFYTQALTENCSGLQMGSWLSKAGISQAGVSNHPHPLADSQLLRRCYEYAASLNQTVFIHPQDPHLGKQGLVHEGLVSDRLGIPGIPVIAETLDLQRHLELIQFTGARAHFCQLTSKQSVALIRAAKQSGANITADVGIAHLILNELDLLDYNTLCFTFPPLRSADDRNALLEGVLDGTLDAISSGHTRVAWANKQQVFSESKPGMAVAEILWSLILQLAGDQPHALKTLIHALTAQPAAILQKSEWMGRMEVGQQANFCLFDPKPHRLGSQTEIKTQSATPFRDWILQGRVVSTWIQGLCRSKLENAPLFIQPLDH